MKKYINIIKMSGTLHCCPGVYDTREEAEKRRREVVCNYQTPHMQTVTKPIEIDFEEVTEAQRKRLIEALRQIDGLKKIIKEVLDANPTS